MTKNDLISEKEAEGFAGVSAGTLRRFSESGYLTVSGDDVRGRLYSRSQLQEIFGANQGGAPAATPTTRADSREVPARQEPSSEHSGPATATTVIHAESSAGVPTSEAPASCESAAGATTSPTADRATPDAHDLERLKSSLEAQAKLLAQRESEVSDLRSQRDWLQRRIESLEEKSNRDQILLLSETQTIRKLIALQEQKRSGLRQLLSWIGLSPQQPVASIPGTSEVVNIPSNEGVTTGNTQDGSRAKAA